MSLGGLYLEGLIFGILRYPINILSDKLCFNFGAKIHQRQFNYKIGMSKFRKIHKRGKFTVNSL